jgi:hypothetical protein
MTAINFPDNPSVNGTYTVGDRTWRWTGTVWESVGTQGPQGPQGEPGLTGLTGLTGATGPAGDPTLEINQQTNTYTVQLSDSSKLVEMLNSGGVNLFIPTDASTNFPLGTQISVIQTGAGQVTVQAVDGISTTINSASGLKLRAIWSVATLIKRAPNLWVATGDLAL